MPTKNYYVVLGVSRDESSVGIRSAYHELARRMHPDIAGPADTFRFQEINESYEVLSDPDRRRAHDRDFGQRETEVPAKKNCFIKDKFWRITTKSGGKKAPAVVAIAHTLLSFIYQALNTGRAYQDKRVPVLDQHQRQRMIRHHIRRLGKLGIAVSSARPVYSATATSPPTNT